MNEIRREFKEAKAGEISIAIRDNFIFGLNLPYYNGLGVYKRSILKNTKG